MVRLLSLRHTPVSDTLVRRNGEPMTTAKASTEASPADIGDGPATVRKVPADAAPNVHAVPVEQTVAVGDGSNDLLMMHAAGMGVAFRAKEKVQREAPRRLNGESLEEVLYLFGGGEFEFDGETSRS